MLPFQNHVDAAIAKRMTEHRQMLKLHLLGQPHITLNGEAVDGFASDKVLTLLAYLVLADAPQRREHLTALFWGDMPEDKARGSLRSALYNLQKVCPGYIETTRKVVGITPETNIWIDSVELQSAVETGSPSTEMAARLSFYRGDFLAGVNFRDAEEADSWLRLERESHRILALRGFKHLLDLQVASGEWQDGAETGKRLLEIEPWHESAHVQLMLCLARSGESAAAIQQYQQCKLLLQDELGVEPMPATTALYERIVAARSAEISNLPTGNTPFVGRLDDLREVDSLLRNQDCRLLSIVGIGGAGKTRLAMAAARTQAGWFLDGVVFVSLAGIEAGTSEQVVAAIADALELNLHSNEAGQSQLIDYLKRRELLLIIDNVEHVLDLCAPLFDVLLQTCNDLKLLITSRERVSLQQEWLLPLEGLPFPVEAAESDEATTFAAVDLFTQTAQRVNRRFAAGDASAEVEQICRLVEGLPLGIELAAALAADQSIPEIAAALSTHFDAASTRYHNIPPRHRSLRATFDYSWGLLSSEEQQLLTNLSVFRGGFNDDAAKFVAKDLYQHLPRLIDRSLVRRQNNDRYDLHEVVRQYSAETLSQSPSLPISPSLLHCQHYTNLLETLAATLNDPEHQLAAQAAFRTDIDNVRAAWRYAIDQPLPEEIRIQAHSYIMYMESTGTYYEGVQQFTYGVEKLRDVTSEDGRHALAQVAWGLGWSYERVGQLADSEAAFDLAVHNARIVEDGASLVVILRQYGLLELARGGLKKAKGMLEESIEIARAEGLDKEYASSVTILAATLNRMGEYDNALNAINESIRLKQELANELEIAISQHNKGEILMRLGRIDEAETLYQQVFELCNTINETMGRIVSRKALGIIALGRGDTLTARGHFEYMLEQTQPISPHMVQMAQVRLGTVDEAEGALDVALERFETALKFMLDAADFGTAASIREALGGLLIKLKRLDDAEDQLKEALKVAIENEQPQIYLNALLSLAEIAVIRGEPGLAGEIVASVEGHVSAEISHKQRAQFLTEQHNLPLQSATDINKLVERVQ